MQRRTFLEMAAAAAASVLGFAAPAPANWMTRKWRIDPRCVLPRGPAGEFDGQVVGDPCIVWDDAVDAWRMFYFAAPGQDYSAPPQKLTVAGMALSKSAEEIAPGDWRKMGSVPLSNPQDMPMGKGGHKFWVVMDPRKINHAARIDGLYWGLFVTTAGPKYIHVVSASRLAGSWTVVPKPILSPNTEGLAPDGKHCDTPTAYWFDELGQVMIFYKAYPLRAQPAQPKSPFGSSSVVAWWRPGRTVAEKGRQILIPGRGETWNRGWIGGFQLLHEPSAGSWYALLNGSPTPPEDLSHREPAPSLAGWAFCRNKRPDAGWEVDTAHSPFAYPETLSPEERQAGLGVNFWRHHLLVTPGGRARIFFNSGAYGTEQMYSLLPEPQS